MSFAIEVTLLLGSAWLLARLAQKLSLPPLLGMLLAGVLLQALYPAIPESQPQLAPYSSAIRLGILTIVLLRAGLGLRLDQFKSAGSSAIRLGVLPLAGDILLLTLGAMWILGFSFPNALVLGCLLGAISPAIVIPTLLELIESRHGKTKALLQTLLVGATLDNIIAIVGLGVALEFALAQSITWSDILWTLPKKLIGGAFIGALLGWALIQLRSLIKMKNQLASTLIVWLTGGLIVLIGTSLHFSFVIGLLITGSLIRSKDENWAQELLASFKSVWGYAQYALFGLIGYAVLLEPLTKVGIAVIGVVLLGQCGRACFSWFSTSGQSWNRHERIACALSYVPKATIQAAFAALPLDKGLGDGETFLGAAIIAIIITAPIGVIGIQRGVARLLPS